MATEALKIEYERSAIGWKAKTQMPSGEFLTVAVRHPLTRKDSRLSMLKAIAIRKARGEYQ